MPYLTFHHFNRKGYSLFAALGQEVRIGVLTAATLATAAPCLAQAHEIAVLQSDSLSRELLLDEATVTAASLAPLATDVATRQVMTFSRDDIAAAGVTSINDLLKLCAGIDLRQRGPHGIQTDIGIDGGTFDQVTLLLNGVNISSPHTGHLSADLPVSPEDIQRVEVLEGSASRIYGTQAFTGVINIVTRSEADGATLSAAGGQYGYASADARLSFRDQHLSAGYSRSDGATLHSAFQNTHIFFQGTAAAGRHNQVDYQLGYSNKPFDANTFYGAGSTTQWERNERWMGALRLTTTVGRLHLRPSVSWNRWYDHYQWKKGSPAGENRHHVDTYTLQLPGWVEWCAGTTAFALEMRNEGIRSTSLGQHNRTNLNASLEHNVILSHWTLSAGVLANLNTALDHRWRFYPGVDVAWRPHRHWTVSGHWSMALRMPTYTDLYYSGKNIEGNDTLKPERAQEVNLRLQWRRPMMLVTGSANYSHKTDMIDWVVAASDPTGAFRSGNYTLNGYGVRLNASWLPRQKWQGCPLRCLSVQYAWRHEDIHYPITITASKYAFEYLRHKVVISADGRLWRNLNMTLSWRWQQRTGLAADSYGLLDGRLSWDATTRPSRRVRGWSLYADVKNILNHHYREYSYVEQPGLWAIGGVKIKF